MSCIPAYFAHIQNGPAHEIQVTKQAKENALDLEQTGWNPYLKHRWKFRDTQGIKIKVSILSGINILINLFSTFDRNDMSRLPLIA